MNVLKPTFDEFRAFCISMGWNDKGYWQLLWDVCERKHWLTLKGKKPKSWQTFVSAQTGVILEKYPMYRNMFGMQKTKQKIDFQTEMFPNNGMHYVCYTDGSCDNLSTQKIGGSAYIILKDNEVIKVKNYGAVGTTNNRMELLAIISAINACPNGSYVDVFTDSQYSILVLSKTRTPKLNADLHALYLKCKSQVADVRFHWVRGHNGDKYNEMADNLAYDAYLEKCREYGIKPNKRH